jgi:hypothetical protein
MMKDIKEISKEEAIELLSFVYPKYDENSFINIHHDWIKTEDGHLIIPFSGGSTIGVEYHNGQDRCILPFNNSKSVLWLYKKGFDITSLLEENSYFSNMEYSFSNFAIEVEVMSKGEESFRDGYKQNWTLEYVMNKCKNLLQKYYYVDYD